MHAIVFKMLPANEPSCPASEMPHNGLTLTGADAAFSPVDVLSLAIMWFGFQGSSPIDDHVPDCKKDCTKNS